jgi:peptide/nickel transport system substrate-binding protein
MRPAGHAGRILKSGLALGGSLAVIGKTATALAQTGRAKTLAIAAPATPLSLDVENSLSLGTIDTVGAFYDYLIEFDMLPDPQLPGVMRENIAPDPAAPGGYHLRGKLAEPPYWRHGWHRIRR